MSTSMPYGQPVEVTTEHVHQLRMTGPDGLLVWQENLCQTAVWAPTAHVDAHTMIIASGRILDTIRRDHPDGQDLDDFDIAGELSILGNETTPDWPRTQALTHLLTPIRRRVWEAEGICLTQAPEYERTPDGTHCITDTYAYPDGDLHARVRVAFAYEKPTRIHLFWPGEDTYHGTEFHLGTCFSTPATTKALMIAETVATALSLGG